VVLATMNSSSRKHGLDREKERKGDLIFVGFTRLKMIHSYLAEFLSTKSKLKPIITRHI